MGGEGMIIVMIMLVFIVFCDVCNNMCCCVPCKCKSCICTLSFFLCEAKLTNFAEIKNFLT